MRMSRSQARLKEDWPRSPATAFDDGYNAALSDCIGLLRHWFWATNKDALACEVDMRKLRKTQATNGSGS